MIERLTEADFDQMFSLMERSFPEDERRDYNGQRELLAEPAYNLYAKRSPEDAALQAFLALWELGDMAYIEHFAVDPDCRNGGLGGKLLQKVIEDTDMRICLEVELPETEMAARRIGFYERNGFYYNDYFYMQPPIAEGRNAIPLRLMTTGGPLDEEEFFRMQGLLYKNVYGVPEDWSWK